MSRWRRERLQRLSKPLQIFVVSLAFFSALTAALAQEQVKIGIGYGLAFLPIYICEDLKLDRKARQGSAP